MRPLILVSNDDGYDAPGIRALADALSRIGDTIIVAPMHEQSAQSHAISLHRPLRHEVKGDDVHAVDGTPADCIYVAFYREDLLPRRPDIVVSGINHGPNLGQDVYYSGTVAAAREGALRGVPAFAFSMCDRRADPVPYAKIAADLVERFLSATRPADQPPLLNVNFPPGVPKGIRATRLGSRLYSDGVDVREDPRGREYYWIGGPGGVRHEPVDGSDTEAMDEGYASITPLELEASHAEHLGLAAFVAGPDNDAQDAP